jgi:low affinity Fe/Cu permease
MSAMNEFFHRVASKVSNVTGSPWAFIVSVLVIFVWAFSGKAFNYSNTWQLVINTGTTIVTFLMVFLIQNTQNRDSKAIHLKLDELIKGDKGARDLLVNVEELSDEELEDLHSEFRKLHAHYDAALKKRKGKLETDEEAYKL